MLTTDPLELGAAGWADQPDEPVDADPDDFDVDEEEPAVDELEEEEVVVVAAVADVVAERIAIDPPSPRNVATLSTPATTRDRAAAWARFRRCRPGPPVVRGSFIVGHSSRSPTT